MANVVSGPYTPHAWIAGDAINATRLNNLETQASDALHGFNPDFIGAGFFVSGCAATGTVGTTTVNIASGTAYTVMTDGTLGKIAVGSATQTTSALSSTYHLYLQPDGTFYWSTSNSPQSNSLAIATVATNGSGQISSITDQRPLNVELLPGLTGAVQVPGSLWIGAGGAAQVSSVGSLLYNSGQNALGVISAGTGAAQGIYVGTWNGSTFVFPISFGGQFHSTPTWVGASGNLGGVAGQTTAGSFGVPMIVFQSLAVAVSTTATQTINYAVTTSGLYRASMYILFRNVGGAQNIVATVGYTDPTTSGGNGATFSYQSNGNSALLLSGGNSISPGSGGIATCPLVFEAQASTNITFTYHDPGGTPNDVLYCLIERLA